MDRRFNIYISDEAGKKLVALISSYQKRNIKITQSQIIEQALIYYHQDYYSKLEKHLDTTIDPQKYSL